MGVKAALVAFFVLSASVHCPTSSLWLAADHCYSVMASGRDGSNQVGGASGMRVDRNGGRMFEAIIVEPTELQPWRTVYMVATTYRQLLCKAHLGREQ